MMQRLAQNSWSQFLRATVAVRPVHSASINCSGHTPGGDAVEDDIVHLADNSTLTIPVYPDRPNEELATRKARLVYQSRKRGMLENDLLLSTFAAKYLPTFNAEQTHQFDSLINKPSNDWDIFYWATNKKPTPPEYETEIMRLLRAHVHSKERERRMPDL